MVAKKTRTAALRRPATVAIHDNRNMAGASRNMRSRKRSILGFGLCEIRLFDLLDNSTLRAHQHLDTDAHPLLLRPCATLCHITSGKSHINWKKLYIMRHRCDRPPASKGPSGL